MIERDIIPLLRSMNSVLKALVRRNLIDEAKEFYNKMNLKGLGVDSVTIRVMMRACLKEDTTEEAEKYFRDAKALGVKLDARAYRMVIQALCRKPNLNVACGLVKEMRDMGRVPSRVYTNLIGA